MDLELKNAIETSNKTIVALRSEIDGMKSADVVSQEKLTRMEADLAKTLAAKTAAETELKAVNSRVDAIELAANRPGATQSKESDEHKQAFVDFIRKGDVASGQRLEELQRKQVTGQDLGSGAYLVPRVISSVITKIVADVSPIRQLASVVTVGTPDYSELLDVRGTAGRWVGEMDDRTETTATARLEKISPVFGEMNARPEATRHALADIGFAIEPWLAGNTAEQFLKMEAEAFLVGNGIDKPKGLLTAPTAATKDAGRAFGTFEHMVSGQADALGGYDPIYNLILGTKAGYRVGAHFLMNSMTLAKYAQIKDNEGRYILQPSMIAGVPYTLCGYPVAIDENMPDVAPDALAVTFGNFAKAYLIADLAVISVIKDEVTRPGFVRWNFFKRVGGCTKDSNAIKHLKIGA